MSNTEELLRQMRARTSEAQSRREALEIRPKDAKAILDEMVPVIDGRMSFQKDHVGLLRALTDIIVLNAAQTQEEQAKNSLQMLEAINCLQESISRLDSRLERLEERMK